MSRPTHPLRTLLLALAIAGAAGGLAACNTFKGLGQDLHDATEATRELFK